MEYIFVFGVGFFFKCKDSQSVGSMVGTKQFENKTAKGMKGSGGKQAELSISCLRISPASAGRWGLGACAACACLGA